MESGFQESQGCYTHSFDWDGNPACAWTLMIALPRVLRYEATEKRAQPWLSPHWILLWDLHTSKCTSLFGMVTTDSPGCGLKTSHLWVHSMTGSHSEGWSKRVANSRPIWATKWDLVFLKPETDKKQNKIKRVWSFPSLTPSTFPMHIHKKKLTFSPLKCPSGWKYLEQLGMMPTDSKLLFVSGVGGW